MPNRDKFMTPKEIHPLIAAAKSMGRLAHALIVLGINLGFRISELVAIRKDDLISLEDNLVRVLTLKQKPGADNNHTVALDSKTCDFIRSYVAKLPRSTPWLFPSPQDDQKHISRVTGWRIFTRAAAKAGLRLVYTPHTMRHSQGVMSWEGTHDLEYVRQKLRHASIQTTGIYVHMSLETQRKQAEKVKPIL